MVPPSPSAIAATVPMTIKHAALEAALKNLRADRAAARERLAELMRADKRDDRAITAADAEVGSFNTPINDLLRRLQPMRAADGTEVAAALDPTMQTAASAALMALIELNHNMNIIAQIADAIARRRGEPRLPPHVDLGYLEIWLRRRAG